MKYNLLGQRGIAGERNPDMSLSDDVATYMYDFPPGQGDNEGATTNNQAVNKSDVENKKVEVALENPNSYIARKPEVEKEVIKKEDTEVKDPGFRQRAIRFSTLPKESFGIIDEQINTVQDLQNYAGVINFTTSQKFYLANKLNIPPKEIDTIITQKGQGPLQSEANPIAQLEFETDYINNFVANRKKILEEEAKGKDTRSLEQKETDYIKNYLETGVLGPVDFKQDVEDIDYIKQLNEETDYIKNYIDNKVSDGIKNNKSTSDIVDDIVDDSKNTVVDAEDDDKTFTPNNLEAIELNNVPVGAEVWDVDGTLYLAYAVPGAGDLYTGSTIWMAYDVVNNDLFEAGLLTAGFEYKGPNGSPSKSWFDSTAVLAGNTNQLIGMDSDPFASFVETYKEEALLRPWLLDNEFIELQAEAALEDRDISEAEWRATTWYQTHSQAERDWMDIELSDPAEAQRQRDDLELYYKNQLQGLGVNNVPDGLIQWVTNKNITGTWSDLKTAEQLQLFADPYKTGERDIEMSNFIATSGFGDVDRTAAREKEVVELYRKWLGPSLGALTQEEVSSIAGRLRDDPDYEDALVNSLKQSRLAAFSNYTNPELTYEDIARPWRNLTTSVWGQNADETQGWWQEMVKSNDYSTAQTTLREKGLEQNINQVSVDASQALQNALGQGSVSQTGVNV